MFASNNEPLPEKEISLTCPGNKMEKALMHHQHQLPLFLHHPPRCPPGGKRGRRLPKPENSPQHDICPAVLFPAAIISRAVNEEC